MNHKLISFVTLLALTASIVANTEVTPTFVARSQGRDAVRQMVGVSDKVHRSDGRDINFSVLLGYTRSFREGDIAYSMFGSDLCCNNSRITVQGSQVANRNEQAWFADYFYLAPDYNSYFDIKPRIQNVIVDLDLYCGLNSLMDGLYLRIHGPLNWTRWNLNFEEACSIQTTGSYDNGYFDIDPMLNNQLLHSFAAYANGHSPLNTTGMTVAGTVVGGVEFEGLNFAKIDGCEHSRTGFADLRMELGYQLFNNDCFDVSINVQVAAPTGNRTRAEFAFDPVVGNRNHWEVGGGLYGHYGFYEDEARSSRADLYVDLSVTHLNRANEQRTFDLNNRGNSRYMLAERMGNPVQFLQAGGQTPSAQFQGLFAPVANLTTLQIPVSIAAQADLVIMVDYKYKNWNFDLGYNFWGRSCEKFGRAQEIPQCCETLCNGSVNQWALKGDAHVFGFASATSGVFTAGNPVALSATECGADIHGGTNIGFTGTCVGNSELQNCGVDNPVIATAVSGATTVSLVTSTVSANAIQTSLQPNFINCCDINLQRTRGLSNKVFANANYTWSKESWEPYVGAGFSAEFGKNDDCEMCAPVLNCDQQQCSNTSCCDNSCNSNCLNASLSQWSIWIKGGLSFE